MVHVVFDFQHQHVRIRWMVMLLDGNAVYISLKDERILIYNSNVKNFKLQLIQSVEDDLVNIYDHGFWNNLIERLKW